MADTTKKITVEVKAVVDNAIAKINKYVTAVNNAQKAKIDDASADAVKKVGNEAEKSTKKINALRSQMVKLKAVVAGAFTASAILGIGKAALSASSNVELLRKGLEFQIGKEDTTKLIKGIQAIGEASAYDTNQLIPMSRAWINMGENADQAMSRIQRLVDLGSAFGLTTDQIEHANLALSQMAAAGKINAQDMMQLTNAGIPSWKMLADAMNMSVTEVRELAAEGKLTGDAINALWDAFSEKTQGAATSLASSLMGQTSNIEEAIANSMAVVGDIIREAFDISGILTQVGEVVEVVRAHLMSIKEAAENIGMKQAILNELSSIDPVIGAIASGLVSAFTTIKNVISDNIGVIKLFVEAMLLIKGTTLIVAGLTAAFGVLGNVIKGLRTAKMIFDAWQVGIIGVRTAFLALTAAMNVNPIVLALTLVSVALVALYNNWDEVSKLVDSAMNAIRDVVADVCGVIARLFDGLSKGVVNVGNAFLDMARSVLPDWASSALDTIADMVNKASAMLKSLADYARDVMNEFHNAAALSRSAANQEIDPENRGSAAKATAYIDVPTKPSVKATPIVGGGGKGKGGGGGSKALSEEEKAIEALIKKYSDADKARRSLAQSEIELAKVNISMMSNEQKAIEEKAVKLKSLDLAHDELIKGYEKELETAKKITNADTRKTVIDGIESQISAEDRLYKAKKRQVEYEDATNQRNLKTAAFEQEMQHIQNLMDMQQISAQQRIELENGVLESRRQQLEAMKADTQLNAEQRAEIEKQLAETIKQIHQNAAYDVQTGWKEALVELANQQINFKDAFVGAFNSIEGSLVSLVSGTESAKDKFKKFCEDVTKTILQAMTQIIIKGLMAKAVMSIFGLGGGGATLYSGGNGFNWGILSPIKIASGGYITGAGTSTSDSIPAMLSNGEYVVNAAAVKRIGVPKLDAINRGGVPHFASGGYVGRGGNSAPPVIVNLHNESGMALDAQQTDANFDGESWVIGIVLNGVATNKNGMRTVLKGAMA